MDTSKSYHLKCNTPKPKNNVDIDSTGSYLRLRKDNLAIPKEFFIDNSKVLKEVIDALVANQLQMRQQAREHKDFAKADEIRDSLANAGIAIDDTQNGARWSVMESEN
jgi:cysteinyl-tRNA synthetase